jgi:hypothetical protein
MRDRPLAGDHLTRCVLNAAGEATTFDSDCEELLLTLKSNSIAAFHASPLPFFESCSEVLE